jgi:hypothetical protein
MNLKLTRSQALVFFTVGFVYCFSPPGESRKMLQFLLRGYGEVQKNKAGMESISFRDMCPVCDPYPDVFEGAKLKL